MHHNKKNVIRSKFQSNNKALRTNKFDVVYSIPADGKTKIQKKICQLDNSIFIGLIIYTRATVNLN